MNDRFTVHTAISHHFASFYVFCSFWSLIPKTLVVFGEKVSYLPNAAVSHDYLYLAISGPYLFQLPTVSLRPKFQGIYPRTFGILWQHYSTVPPFRILDFPLIIYIFLYLVQVQMPGPLSIAIQRQAILCQPRIHYYYWWLSIINYYC